ncbi:hypothetical protein HMN09_00544900 [Mycena chlorophos]|uniref:beta-glucosidase n=1 Tax=Mycena chlorophos TaxID=658473 RepID=A0A8H6TC38_MYCCL|nr:hypothetical protein HMN09_00544900 [Mycena chlorophos]
MSYISISFSGNLIEAVAATTIVVIPSVGPVDLSWSEHPNITAIIYAGAPGEQTGLSLVDGLYGAVNPSGRLPFSVDENEAFYGTSIAYDGFGFHVTERLLLDDRTWMPGTSPRTSPGSGYHAPLSIRDARLTGSF